MTQAAIKTVEPSSRRYGSVIGTFYSVVNKKGIQYNSLTECICLYKLEQTPNVKSYKVRPIEIPTFLEEHLHWLYTPHVQVVYKNGITELIEIKKSVEDAEKKEKLIAETVGRLFPKERRWLYTVQSEEAINPVEKKNLKFLFGFRNRCEKESTLFPKLQDLLNQETTIRKVVESLGIEVLPLIYYSVFSNRIDADLTKEKINLDTRINMRKQEGGSYK